ncbi:hypothetical protein LEP1GSC065_1233 [Leptospira kirschneri serovar Sokoine str. RM1]|nr:hypothetical protein LEP1GSC065_1233 [Leptospira kirschneri serovar Sokoine str. RM1]
MKLLETYNYAESIRFLPLFTKKETKRNMIHSFNVNSM